MNILETPKSVTQYRMVEGSTATIGHELTELALSGWHPMTAHQSYISPGSYSKHSVLVMRVVTLPIVETNDKPERPPTLEYRK